MGSLNIKFKKKKDNFSIHSDELSFFIEDSRGDTDVPRERHKRHVNKMVDRWASALTASNQMMTDLDISRRLLESIVNIDEDLAVPEIFEEEEDV